MTWSPEAEATIDRLMRDVSRHPDGLREPGVRLSALPVGHDLWSAWFLRPDGDLLVLGEDEDRPDEVRIYRERERRLSALVGLSRRYPEIRPLIPCRPPDATDCPCIGISVFDPGQMICPTCGGVGWLPPDASD